jgi:hypothetical protein
MDIAGLIFNDSSHYLDHLAPFCALRKWPLILCEPSLAHLAREHYPGLTVIERPWSELKLPKKIISCHPQPMLQSAFPFANIQTFWLPHGNSDKGWKSAAFEQLRYEQTALVYGRKMIDCIQEKNGQLPHLQIETVGNFREAYYRQNKTFYRDLVQKKFSVKGKALLYAPTWGDFEDNSSFWQAFPILAKYLPDHYTLLVKPHPNTITAFAPELERLIGQYEKKTNILWILDFPPIYPLLEICDGYVGDMSSIGYDFLFFNRPMYFLNAQKRDIKTDPGLYLYRCGIELLPEEYKKLFSLDEETHHMDRDRFRKIREKVYQYTFDPRHLT